MPEDIKQNTIADSLASRLERALARSSYTQETLAEACNTSQATISRILNGVTQRSKHIPTIANVLNVSEQWLIFGDQSNVKKIDAVIDEWNDETPIPDDMAAIPFFKDMSLSAGRGSLNSDIPYNGAKLWYAKSFLRRKNTCPDMVFCISVVGDSMHPIIQEGGMVMIDTLNKDIIDGRPYAVRYKDEDYIKYLQRGDGVIKLVSENKKYDDIIAKTEDLDIIGKVIEYSKVW